jgi:hypothetical protein
MSQPLINACAGELCDQEYEYCRSIAYRLLLAMIVGNFLGDCTEFGDPGELWHGARDEIRDEPEADAVLEILANTLSHAMVEKDGQDGAIQHVKKILAEVDPGALP